MKNIFKKNKKKKGFSLIEVLVALFVFSLLVATLANVFVGFLGAQQNAKNTQRNLEGAQLALNSLAKTLRTSKIIAPTASPWTVDRIIVYDYSKAAEDEDNACLEYVIVGDKLSLRAGNLDETTCAEGALPPGGTSLIDGRVFGGFMVTPFVDGVSAGKITVSLQLCPKGGDPDACNATTGNPIRIQTTVSLRVNK